MSDVTLGIEMVDGTTPRVSVTIPRPDQIAAIVAALLALWRAVGPILAGGIGPAIAAAVTAAAGTGPAAADPPAVAAAGGPGTRPGTAGPGARR